MVILGLFGLVLLGAALGMVGMAILAAHHCDECEAAYEDSEIMNKVITDRNPFEGQDGYFKLDPRYKEERDAMYAKKEPSLLDKTLSEVMMELVA